MADFGTYVNNDPYRDFYNLSNAQAGQSLSAGDRAARYADPFMNERAAYQTQLRNLVSTGDITQSPFYQLLKNQEMEEQKAKNAASGNFNSGRGAMALQDRLATVAAKTYFPQVAALTQLAQGGSSPSAAGMAYTRGIERSQDQSQMAAMARAASRQPPPQAPAAAPTPTAAPAASTAPSFGLPYGGGYDTMKDPMAGYTPSANAGTGYVLSSSGATDLNGPGGGQYYAYGGTPAAQPQTPRYDYGSLGINPTAPQNYEDYADYGSSDFGYGGE